MFQQTAIEPQAQPYPYLPPIKISDSPALLSNDYVRVAYASDLHLDFEDINDEFFEPVADVLILAGDIHESRRLESQNKKFWRRCSENFTHVLYIPGNHEYYHGAIPKADFELERGLAHLENVHFLQNRTFNYKGVHFVGATLWTDFNGGNPITQMAVANYMNDFHVIKQSENGFRKFTTQAAILEHLKSRRFIERELSTHSRDPVVVLTHHAPSCESIAPRFRDQYHENYGYYTNLENLLLDREVPTWWIHGHVHYPFDYPMGVTRVLCNPRGYPGERPYGLSAYQPRVFTIDLPTRVSIL